MIRILLENIMGTMAMRARPVNKNHRKKAGTRAWGDGGGIKT
ncbi:hypothetical protein MICA_5 [Micavibrio aeruginosavorus ARL-13]|uniref:Uncharacterized protein n=1 Tax=Micavibrio aeruginosavorus (strain ARL-13) TaxID=856793 RepID=G2KLB7_MICAA|nr:hypothetical protein MICA_5 [Micavibrio aeruginosavorus ARL-13]